MGGGARGTSIDEFNGDNFDHSGLGFMGGAYVAVSSSGAMPIRSTPVPPGTPRWGSAWKRAATQYYHGNFTIALHGGSQSFRSHYLDLDPTYRDARLPLLRMTLTGPEREEDVGLDHDKAAEIAKAPARQMSVNPTAGHYSIVPYQSTHNVGGA